MAQFRSTADILDLALQKAGEVTNGNSPYETQALNYLNRVHYTLISGGTIPVGKDETVVIDEVWPWSRAKSPMVIELQPKYDTGTISLTLGSEVGAFSSAPSISLAGYHIKVTGKSPWFKIASHSAASTAFDLDGAYTDDTGTGLSYIAVKIDYQLVPSYIVVNNKNDKFYFSKVSDGLTVLTATLTHGAYTPSDFITHVATVATTAASGPTITGAYDSVARKFTLTSNLSGSTYFRIVGHSSSVDMLRSAHKTLGYEDELASHAAAQISTYPLGCISRLVEPIKISGDGEGNIYSVDQLKYQKDYPLNTLMECSPSRFTVIDEEQNGTYTVRFNGYVTEKTRIEVEHVPVPVDLKDNASSIPLIPRKHIDVLEDAAVFYLMLDKSDDRAALYAQLLSGKIKAMVAQNRGGLNRAGKYFGQTIPRLDLLGGRKKLIYGERD